MAHAHVFARTSVRLGAGAPRRIPIFAAMLREYSLRVVQRLLGRAISPSMQPRWGFTAMLGCRPGGFSCMASVLAALPEQACPKAYSVPSVAVGGAPFGCFAADREPHAAAPPTNFLRLGACMITWCKVGLQVGTT